MKTIGIVVAKDRLFELIDRVEVGGEIITIVRNGVPVAQVQPFRQSFEDAKRSRPFGRRVSNETKPISNDCL